MDVGQIALWGLIIFGVHQVGAGLWKWRTEGMTGDVKVSLYSGIGFLLVAVVIFFVFKF